MTKVNYEVGDVIRFENVNTVPPTTSYFLITGVDRLRDYTVLCLQTNDRHQYAWRVGERGEMSRAAINTYGKKVA
jgi:hypothetical protein